jgi:CBS domain-containing protein
MEACARDIMSRDVIAVTTKTDLRDLAKLFLERGITGAPVVDEQGELAGVVSQTDLIYYQLTRGDELVLDSDFYQRARVEGRHVPRGFQIEDFNSGSVEDIMTPVVHSVAESTSVASIARLMTRKHIHRVIVRRGRKIAGVISALDVIRAQTKSAPATRSAAATTRRGTAPKTRARSR